MEPVSSGIVLPLQMETEAREKKVILPSKQT